ncbi:MAG: hypothetical protein LBQ22_12210 [Bacteroidales bacterium]|jgi:nitrite reductase/ring-hydroxylating ferredoxin subunit|nr:hypothetical protein [Bacteroidales bacterium]
MKNISAKLLIFFIFILTILPSCEDSGERIPYVPVNIIIYPDLPEYNTIKTPMNHIYLNGGYAGIIVYCEYADSYKAYERNCPHNPSHPDAILDVDSTNLFMVCRECKSKFSILYGNKVDGPAKNPVVEYKTTLFNSALYITNYN